MCVYVGASSCTVSKHACKHASLQRSHLELGVHYPTPCKLGVKEMYQAVFFFAMRISHDAHLYLSESIASMSRIPQSREPHSRHAQQQRLFVPISNHPPILARLEVLHLSHLFLQRLEPRLALRRQVEARVVLERVEQGRVGQGGRGRIAGG